MTGLKKKLHGKGTNRQTHKQTHGHVDYKTNSAQRAELVKTCLLVLSSGLSQSCSRLPVKFLLRSLIGPVSFQASYRSISDVKIGIIKWMYYIIFKTDVKNLRQKFTSKRTGKKLGTKIYIQS